MFWKSAEILTRYKIKRNEGDLSLTQDYGLLLTESSILCRAIGKYFFALTPRPASTYSPSLALIFKMIQLKASLNMPQDKNNLKRHNKRQKAKHE